MKEITKKYIKNKIAITFDIQYQLAKIFWEMQLWEETAKDESYIYSQIIYRWRNKDYINNNNQIKKLI